MQQISEPSTAGSTAFLALGFRPLFFFAALAAVALMGLWAWMLAAGQAFAPAPVGPLMWHGHEMVFGYGLAVAGGFLLTAVGNWTGQQTLNGWPLLLLVLLWLLARLGWSTGGALPIALAAFADLAFGVWLVLALLWPVARVRQWQQLGLLGLVLLLVAANGWSLAGVMGLTGDGGQGGLYLGLYVLVALIMTMGRRVIPFFIEKGVGCPFQATNRRWLDLASQLLFAAFVLCELWLDLPALSASLAAAQCLLHGIRLWGWHTPALWRRPLLWVLFVGYGWLVVGFALHALAGLGLVSPFVALHAFAVGAIGLVSLGMMARVSLGHTGRSVFELPPLLTPVFLALAGAAVLRVFGPLLTPGVFDLWILLSQLLWLVAFGLLLALYAPMWWRPRVDGRPG